MDQLKNVESAGLGTKLRFPSEGVSVRVIDKLICFICVYVHTHIIHVYIVHMTIIYDMTFIYMHISGICWAQMHGAFGSNIQVSCVSGSFEVMPRNSWSTNLRVNDQRCPKLPKICPMWRTLQVENPTNTCPSHWCDLQNQGATVLEFATACGDQTVCISTTMPALKQRKAMLSPSYFGVLHVAPLVFFIVCLFHLRVNLSWTIEMLWNVTVMPAITGWFWWWVCHVSHIFPSWPTICRSSFRRPVVNMSPNVTESML